jgi:hypothetical protein
MAKEKIEPASVTVTVTDGRVTNVDFPKTVEVEVFDYDRNKYSSAFWESNFEKDDHSRECIRTLYYQGVKGKDKRQTRVIVRKAEVENVLMSPGVEVTVVTTANGKTTRDTWKPGK